MANSIRVDSHVHLYRSSEEGQADKDGYEIWEYGSKPDVCFSERLGTVDEVMADMEATGISKAVVVNLYIGTLARDKKRATVADSVSGSERDRAYDDIEAEITGEMKAFNSWICGVSQSHSEIIPFIGADATVLPGDEGGAYVRDMVVNHGARGVKLHGASQGFSMSDERLWATYAACQDLGVSVIGHSGPDRGGAGFADPRGFGGMLKAFPELNVVLAHMGGANWGQALEIAESHPNAYFDCCEIIEWTEGTNAPSEVQLAQLIKDIGPHRVMMGSDYPWYDLDHTVERVMELPLLSAEEKQGIIGANAVTILNL
ncbi:MAG: amidohydrolase family protein [Alphaproteobacteria bacterium]|jgi:predicted TIM-barrel fold metal-dependent hydrolase